MTRIALLATLVSPLMFANPAAAQSALAWKFAQGDVFFIQRDIKNEQVLTIKDKILKAETQATWVFRFEVQTPAKDPAKDPTPRRSRLASTPSSSSTWSGRRRSRAST